jgi:membrane-bound lytic murein transglycosylase B
VHLRAITAVLLLATATVLAQNGSAGSQETAPTTPAAAQEPGDSDLDFSAWLMALVEEARTRGYSDALIAQTLSGLEPLHRVIQNDRNQAELNPGFSRYLSSRLTRTMIQQGRDRARQHQQLLAKIEARYGVPRRFILAIWGLETRYGRVTGSTPIFQALATLAWEPRRADFFRGELFNALTMVDRGYIDARTMTGSWAGAMGQTQFMPSSYLEYAVDFDQNGRRDIWKSTPDALASIANYLKGYGWAGNLTWGREVRVPDAALAAITETIPKRPEGCYAIRNMTERVPLDRWRELGVTNVDGTPLPKADATAGLVDVGDRKFLVYPNYDAILGYNCAHYYALSVALLGDQIAGINSQLPKAKSQTKTNSRATTSTSPQPVARSPKPGARSRRRSR